ncbi:MAG: hypothetical protein ACRDND_32370, partial [Streptosporangiaceae bacterium]
MAMGINGIAAVSGSFIGLILGGVLAPIEWRLVFLVSVPFGLERVAEQQELRLGIDPGTLRRGRQPGPAHLHRAQVVPDPLARPRPRLAVRRAPHRRAVPHPHLREARQAVPGELGRQVLCYLAG